VAAPSQQAQGAPPQTVPPQIASPPTAAGAESLAPGAAGQLQHKLPSPDCCTPAPNPDPAGQTAEVAPAAELPAAELAERPAARKRLWIGHKAARVAARESVVNRAAPRRVAKGCRTDNLSRGWRYPCCGGCWFTARTMVGRGQPAAPDGPEAAPRPPALIVASQPPRNWLKTRTAQLRRQQVVESDGRAAPPLPLVLAQRLLKMLAVFNVNQPVPQDRPGLPDDSAEAGIERARQLEQLHRHRPTRRIFARGE
jgi:hypothetical protein